MRTKRAKELSDLIEFVEFTNLFRKVERLIWFKGVEGRERVGEHSFQLALVCWFVNERCELGLNTGLMIEYPIVHDIFETYAEDTPAFGTHYENGEPIPQRSDKAAREKAAERRIIREWGEKFPPPLINRMTRYARQEDEESRFVYAMDKVLALLNVYTDGGRSWHMLDVTIETMDLYKRPRVAAHAFVKELYEELFKILSREQKKLFAPSKEPIS